MPKKNSNVRTIPYRALSDTLLIGSTIVSKAVMYRKIHANKKLFKPITLKSKRPRVINLE